MINEILAILVVPFGGIVAICIILFLGLLFSSPQNSTKKLMRQAKLIELEEWEAMEKIDIENWKLTMWKCKYCEMLNDRNVKFCEHCGSPRRS